MAEDPNKNAKSLDDAGSEKETGGARSGADGGAAGPMQKSKVEGIWDKILLVFLGIALTSIATYLNANHQASLERKQQREQFLMNERISALDQYANVLNGNGEVFEKLDDFQWALIQARESPESSKAWIRVIRTSRAFQAEEVKWDANLRARGLIMAAIFKRSIYLPSFPPAESLPSISFAAYRKKARRRKQLTALADRMFTGTRKIHSRLVALMGDYQASLEKMSKHVY